jgi:hypothetical protein
VTKLAWTLHDGAIVNRRERELSAAEGGKAGNDRKKQETQGHGESPQINPKAVETNELDRQRPGGWASPIAFNLPRALGGQGPWPKRGPAALMVMIRSIAG